MASLEPFFGLLLSSDASDESCSRPVTSKEWTRFALYASKTRTLAISSSGSMEMRSKWLMYLLTSEGCPKPLFPCLKTLCLGTNTSISFLVAFSSAPHLHALNIRLDDVPTTKHDCLALTAALGQLEEPLVKHMHVSQPVVNKQILANISQIRSITSLSISLGGDLGDMGLSAIRNLKALRTLEIHQPRDLLNLDDPEQFQKAQDILIKPHLRTRLPELEILKVKATGVTQYQIAAAVYSEKLTSVTMTIETNCRGLHAAVVPLALDLHIKQSSLLKTVDVTSRLRTPLRMRLSDPQLEILRGNFTFTNWDSLLRSLATLTKLRFFRFDRIPVLALDATARLLEVSLTLPCIRSLYINPYSISNYQEDQLIVPDIRVLENIAATPTLRDIRLRVVLPQTLNLPKGRSDSQVESLFLVTAIPEFVGNTQDHQMQLATYLDRLFPHVKDLSSWHTTAPLNGSVPFWRSVEKLLLFRQDAREQAIEDLTDGSIFGGKGSSEKLD